MKTLSHGQQVKIARMRFEPEITVGTVEGYAKQYKEDPAVAVARCLENQKTHPHSGHVLAWTNKAASVLTADYAGKAEALEAKRQAYENAVELTDGEQVEIEGRKYTVKYMGDYSDPIHFIPVI